MQEFRLDLLSDKDFAKLSKAANLAKLLNFKVDRVDIVNKQFVADVVNAIIDEVRADYKEAFNKVGFKADEEVEQ